MNSRGFGQACFVMLGMFMIARVAVAFLPAGPWSPSGYQCGSYYLMLPFGRPHTCIADAAFGEGARVSGRLDYVSFRREKFTVDARGYRNLPAAGKPSVILFGSSFSLGLSLSDEDTIAARLEGESGLAIYNASNVLNTALSTAPITRVADFLKLDKGLVLLEILNREGYGYGPPPRERRFDDTALLQSLERRIRNPFAITRISSLWNMRLQNDRLLPNPDKFRFAEEELANGRRMLFYAQDKHFFESPSDPGPTAAAVASLRDDLARRGLKLAVMLVPTGYSVYHPLFREQSGSDTGGLYMASLAAQLAGAGVPVFDCLAVLRAAAARELAAGRLIYWPDDAHWNPLGAGVAAHALTPWLRTLTDAVQ
jgi:hypothetical protein